MILTEQMKLMLFQVLSDSLNIKGIPFILDQKSRLQLYQNILNIQDRNIEKEKRMIFYSCKEMGNNEMEFKTIFETTTKETAEAWVNEMPHRRCYHEMYGDEINVV